MPQEKKRLFIPADGGENAGRNNPLASVVEEAEAATKINDSAIDAATEVAQERIAERARQSEVTETSWFNVDMSKLAKQGRLYPSDLQIIYRACRSGEIRHWSNLDDNANPAEVATYLNDIVKVCVRCVSKSGMNHWSVDDIYEHDKWYLIMLIHGLTFPENSELTNPITLEISSGTCKHNFKLDLTADNMTWDEPDESMDKYIDSETGCYRVQTRSYGELILKPSTIGVGKVFAEYMRTLDKDTLMNAKTYILAAQWLTPDWRGLNVKKAEQICQSFQAMDAFKELPLKLKILSKCMILASNNIKFTCPKCHMEGEAPFRFPEGIKQIFQPVQNLESELL